MGTLSTRAFQVRSENTSTLGIRVWAGWGVNLANFLITVVIRMFYRGGPIASREGGSQMCRLQVFGLIDSSEELIKNAS